MLNPTKTLVQSIATALAPILDPLVEKLANDRAREKVLELTRNWGQEGRNGVRAARAGGGDGSGIQPAKPKRTKSGRAARIDVSAYADKAFRLISENTSAGKKVKRRDVINTLGLTESQATGVVAKLVDDGRIKIDGEKNGAHYVVKGSSKPKTTKRAKKSKK